MPAPTSDNLTIWRTGKPFKATGYVYILKPTLVFQAQVNQATTTYPLTSLTFDNVTLGAYTDIEPEQTLILGTAPGLDDLGRQRVRAVATSTTIPVGRSSRGVGLGELKADDNVYITVLDLREVRAKIPFINASGISLKDQVSFSQAIAQPPIANGGGAKASLEDRVSHTFSFDFSGANSQLVDATGNPLTHAWDFRDGTPSTASTQDVAGVEFPTGFRYVAYTVNDGSRSHTTYIPVAVLPRSGEGAPIPARITRRNLKSGGQEASFIIDANAVSLPLSDYPSGTLVIYFERERYGTQFTGSLTGNNVKFVGWLTTEATELEAGATGTHKTLTLQAEDVLARLSKMPSWGQVVDYAASPANWQQMANANVNRYVHHLLHWHSNVLAVAPFQWAALGSQYPFPSLSSDGQNLFSQVNQVASAFAHELRCTQSGELRVAMDLQRILVADRPTTVMAPLQKSDFYFVGYTNLFATPKAHWTWGSAILTGNTQVKAVKCLSPGSAPSWGESSNDVGQQLVRSQTELNERTGHDYARLNARYDQMTIRLTHGGDLGIDPAFSEWLTFDIDSGLAGPRQDIFSGRFVVVAAAITLDPVTGRRSWELTVEKEVVGLASLAVVVPPSGSSSTYQPYPVQDTYGNAPENPDIINPPVTIPGMGLPPGQPTPTPLPKNGNTVAYATASIVRLTRGFRLSTKPVWDDLTPDLGAGESIVDLGFFGLGTTLLMLTNTTTQSYLYCLDDPLLGASAWVKGAALSGLYKLIRPSSSSDKLFLYQPDTDTGTSTTISDNLTSALGPNSHEVSVTYPMGFIDSSGSGTCLGDAGGHFTGSGGRGGGGCIASEAVADGGGGRVISQAAFVIDLGSEQTVTNVSCWGFWDKFDFSSGFWMFAFYDSGKALVANFGQNEGFGDMNNTWAKRDETSEPGWTPVSGVRYVSFSMEGNPTSGGPYNRIDDFSVTYGFSSSKATVAYSGSNGLTWVNEQEIGDSPGAIGGMDAIKVGPQSLAAKSGQIVIATTLGGAYADYGGVVPTGGHPSLVLFPHYLFGSTTLLNTNDNTPEYLLGSDVADGLGHALWKVTSNGSAFADITPVIGGNPGLVVHPSCITMPWKSGKRIAAILLFDTVRKLVTTVDTGATWVDAQDLSADAVMVKSRKGDVGMSELYIADGAPAFSRDYGLTVVPREYPDADPILALDVYG